MASSSDHSTTRPANRCARLTAWLLGVFAAAAATWLSGAGDSLYHAVFPARVATSRTELRYFRVSDQLSGSLRSLLRVGRYDSATCGADFSIADQGAVPEAHRCFGHGKIYDPCFDYAYNELECIETPWDSVSVRVRIVKESWISHKHVLPARPRGTPALPPWALELTNGDRCVFLTGATGVIAGNLRLNYRCKQGTVYGEPDRSGPVWLVSYAPGGVTGSIPTEVRVAWY
jgi:hypothetical protein